MNGPGVAKKALGIVLGADDDGDEDAAGSEMPPSMAFMQACDEVFIAMKAEEKQKFCDALQDAIDIRLMEMGVKAPKKSADSEGSSEEEY